MSGRTATETIEGATHQLTELAPGGVYVMTIIMPGRLSGHRIEAISDRIRQWAETISRPADCHIIPIVFEGGTTVQLTRVGVDPHAKAIEAMGKRIAELERAEKIRTSPHRHPTLDSED